MAGNACAVHSGVENSLKYLPAHFLGFSSATHASFEPTTLHVSSRPLVTMNTLSTCGQTSDKDTHVFSTSQSSVPRPGEVSLSLRGPFKMHGTWTYFAGVSMPVKFCFVLIRGSADVASGTVLAALSATRLAATGGGGREARFLCVVLARGDVCFRAVPPCTDWLSAGWAIPATFPTTGPLSKERRASHATALPRARCLTAVTDVPSDIGRVSAAACQPAGVVFGYGGQRLEAGVRRGVTRLSSLLLSECPHERQAPKAGLCVSSTPSGYTLFTRNPPKDPTESI